MAVYARFPVARICLSVEKEAIVYAGSPMILRHGRDDKAGGEADN